MKYLYLLLFASICFTGCEREAFDYNKNPESGTVDDSLLPDVTVSLASLKLALTSGTTRSTIDELANYWVRIYNQVTTDTLTWRYSELPDLITLKPRSYTVAAYSHTPAAVAWESPYYFASKEFQVKENSVTNIGTLTCKLASILVSVSLDEKLAASIQEDAYVVIQVGKGRLTYRYGEERIGSFMPLEESNTLTAELYATTLTGQTLTLSGISFVNVKAGEHRVVKFVLNETETNPDESVPSQVEITIDATCERIDQDVTVQPGEEPLLPEEPEGPENPDAQLPMIEGVGFDLANPIFVPAEGAEVKVAIASEVGFTHLFVTIDSETLTDELLTDVGLAKTFDLAHPAHLEEALRGLGFPTGTAVIGQEEILFDITPFTPLLGIYGAATHRFVIRAVDANGETTGTLTLISQ